MSDEVFPKIDAFNSLSKTNKPKKQEGVGTNILSIALKACPDCGESSWSKLVSAQGFLLMPINALW